MRAHASLRRRYIGYRPSHALVIYAQLTTYISSVAEERDPAPDCGRRAWAVPFSRVYANMSYLGTRL
jgi:hypothetical protein